jgi:hypothetical protein
VGSKDWLEEELEGYEDDETDFEEGEEVNYRRDPNLLKAERHQKKLRRQREEEKRAQEEAP